MKALRRSDRRYIGAILAISLLGWSYLLASPGQVKHCLVADSGPSAGSLQMLLAMNPISVLLTGWTIMVIAMMLPKLTGPVRSIVGRSLKSRRLRSVLLFVGGYLGVWMGVGLLMIAVIIGSNLFWPGSFLPALSIGLIALVWQCAPVKQRCLNRGHRHPNLAAFGWEADRDALLFGLEHGCWCVGSGWALMLFPMLLPAGHNPAMLAVTVLMISEHLEHPQVPRWRFNLSGKLLRGLYAQTAIRLQQMRVRV